MQVGRTQKGLRKRFLKLNIKIHILWFFVVHTCRSNSSNKVAGFAIQAWALTRIPRLTDLMNRHWKYAFVSLIWTNCDVLEPFQGSRGHHDSQHASWTHLLEKLVSQGGPRWDPKFGPGALKCVKWAYKWVSCGRCLPDLFVHPD